VLWVDDVDEQLGTVNLGSGAVTLVGNTNAYLTDIGFDSNGNLWGVDPNANFYTVSTTTGTATYLTSLDTGVDFNALVGGANGSLFAAAANNKDLFTINSSTGKDSVVGNTGFDAAGDLAFVNGTLYEAAVDPANSTVDDLVKITLSPTFSATDVGSFGIPDVYGLASDNSGVLYAVANTQIYTVNLDTAALTPVLDYGGNSAGLTDANGEAFLNESAGATPSNPTGPTSSIVPLPTAVWSGLILLVTLAGARAIKRLSRA